jgi:hypothetical protein
MREDIYLFTTAFKPALGPTQPPVQWVKVAFSPRYSGWNLKLITHLHIVPR